MHVHTRLSHCVSLVDALRVSPILSVFIVQYVAPGWFPAVHVAVFYPHSYGIPGSKPRGILRQWKPHRPASRPDDAPHGADGRQSEDQRRSNHGTSERREGEGLSDDGTEERHGLSDQQSTAHNRHYVACIPTVGQPR
jgi:hypothetical protein